MATTTKQDRVRELQRALYRAAKADSRMPAVKNVGEPCAGEPHARFEVAAGGNRNQSAIAARNWAPPADPTRQTEPNPTACARPRGNARSVRRVQYGGAPGPQTRSCCGRRAPRSRLRGRGSDTHTTWSLVRDPLIS